MINRQIKVSLLHVMGRDGFICYTESKNVTQTYFAEDKEDYGRVDTWDGTRAALSTET